MKLVDILARELKVWAATTVAYVQDGNGDIWPCRNIPAFERDGWYAVSSSFIDQNSEAMHFALPETVAEDYYNAVVTLSQWQAAVDALKGESSPTWVGVGNPPVGTWCKMSDSIKTIRAKVLFYGKATVVVEADSGEEFAIGLKFVKFELDRTPEQIKADERAAAITQMTNDAGNASALAIRVYGNLYDIGYRKGKL